MVITNECGNRRWPNLAGMGKGDPLEVINFWWWSGSTCGLCITFSFSSPLRNRRFLDICKHFSYNQRPICTIFGEATDFDKIMHPQHHFGTDPTDIGIQINPIIRIGIPDHFWLKFWSWWRFALSWVLLLYTVFSCLITAIVSSIETRADTNSFRMRVMTHNWSVMKQCLHPQSVARPR